MEKIVFNRSDSEFEMIPFKPDENGLCHELCPYGQGWTDEEHAENERFARKLGGRPCPQTYLVGTAPCVRRCKYSKGQAEGVKVVMCAYKYLNKA